MMTFYKLVYFDIGENRAFLSQFLLIGIYKLNSLKVSLLKYEIVQIVNYNY